MGDSSALNVFRAENTVNGTAFLDMLGEIVMSLFGGEKLLIKGHSLKKERPGICTLQFWQDWLDTKFPRKRIESGIGVYKHLID
jgi:hypothetical protein